MIFSNFPKSYRIYMIIQLWWRKDRTDTSSNLDVVCKKVDLENFAKLKGKHLYQSLFLLKLQAEACNFI